MTGLRFAALVFALALWPAMASAEPSYVYLGIQSGRQPVMEFVAPSTVQKWGQQTNVSILKVLYPARADSEAAYRIDSNVYDCARKTVARDASATYDKDNHLLGKASAAQKPVSLAGDRGLDRLAFDYICGESAPRKTAAIALWKAVDNSRIVMALQTLKGAPAPNPVVQYLPDYIASPYGIAVPPSGFFAVPTQGGPARISNIYRARDGHLVVAYTYRADQTATGYRSDYYDMLLKRPLFPNQAQAMAYSHDDLQGRLKPSNLRAVESSIFDMLAPEGSDAATHYYGGSVCRQAYANSLSATGPEGEVEVAYFRKLAKPESYKSECGGPEVQLHYRNAAMSPLAPDKQGFLASADNPSLLVWFDWRLHSKYFARQRDIIAVPWEEFQQALQGHDDMPDRKGYKKAEALIARYGDLQMEGRSPLSMMGR